MYESHTECIHYMAEEARVLALITSKIKEFIQYYGFTMTKVALQRCENEEIGGVLVQESGRHWTLERFERLLAALKSKRHKQAQKCIVFGASVRWAFELINASGPGIPTT